MPRREKTIAPLLLIQEVISEAVGTRDRGSGAVKQKRRLLSNPSYSARSNVVFCLMEC